MKIATLLFISLFLTNLATAQFGITGRYHLNNASDWVPINEKNASDPYKFLGDGWSIGVDSWLRLKNYRVEFLPELNFAQYKSTPGANIPTVESFSNHFYSFFLNTNFYVFDFAGDCHCPTFSKQGQFLKKGFFLQVSPGISYLQNEVQMSEAATLNAGAIYKSSEWAMSIGAGAGLDIGLNDFMTFTPMLGLRYFPNAKWTSLVESSSLETFTPASAESNIWQWTAGARLGFRFDYQSNRRRR